MSNIWVIFKRELAGYFTTPIAYIFMIIFVFLSGIFAFYIGNFFERGQADLLPFFSFHPWLYLFLIPALAMRLWAEERKGGTIELLLTMPITMPQAVLGKFLAAWAFTAIALSLTIPIWITVNYLGEPDNGIIFSAVTRNQVVAFVVSAVICLLFVLSGFPLVLDFFSVWAPEFIVSAISSFSFLTHFDAISKGVIDIRDIIYFISVIAFWLYTNAVLIEYKKAD